MNIENKPNSIPLATSANAVARPDAAAGDVRAKAGDAIAHLSDVAQAAGQQAKDTATSLASEANEKAKGIIVQQIAAGSDWVGHLAEATKAAADNLTQNAPQLSGLVRDAATKVEQFSKTLKDQSIEDLYQSASNFTRRQPAVVFGSAALFGFLVFRLLKTESKSGAAATARNMGPKDTYRSGSSHGA
ncbi:MAG TPA: hypothetical protein VGN55_10610 [Xanthobacteraceae bacterium]|jgi:uncharacterized phage infection (PIP) family protein YhgE